MLPNAIPPSANEKKLSHSLFACPTQTGIIFQVGQGEKGTLRQSELKACATKQTSAHRERSYTISEREHRAQEGAVSRRRGKRVGKSKENRCCRTMIVTRDQCDKINQEEDTQQQQRVPR